MIGWDCLPLGQALVCVILVAEGRASNYLFGAVNSAIYLVLALNKNFYGEF